MVLRVDKEKGYIDLSKRYVHAPDREEGGQQGMAGRIPTPLISGRRRVNPEDIQKCEDRFNKSKMVHSIMRHVAETTHMDLEVRSSLEGGPLPLWGQRMAVTSREICSPFPFEAVVLRRAGPF